MVQNSVRRNLFHRNLSRRPATEDEENPIKSHPMSKSRLPPKGPGSLQTALLQAAYDKCDKAENQAMRRAEELKKREIAILDKHGKYLFDRAPTLPLSFIEWETSQTEAEAEKKAYHTPFQRDDNLSSRKDEAHEKELIRRIKESLVSEVESLAVDNWMYEPDHNPAI